VQYSAVLTVAQQVGNREYSTVLYCFNDSTWSLVHCSCALCSVLQYRTVLYCRTSLVQPCVQNRDEEVSYECLLCHTLRSVKQHSIAHHSTAQYSTVLF
jgi:hypothetical protein